MIFDIFVYIIDILFLRKSLLLFIFRFVLFLGILFFGLLIYLAYKEVGTFNFFAIKNLVFNQDFIVYIFYKYKQYFAILGIANTTILLVLYFIQDYQIRNRKHCGLQKVALEEIAKIWLENEAYLEVAKEKVKEEVKREVKEERLQTQIIVPEFNMQRSKDLFNEYVVKNQEYFDEYSIRIIIDLIRFLEKFKDNPSVVSLFKDDFEYKQMTKDMVISGYSSYDILREVDIYTHTFNVVDKSIEILKAEKGDEYRLSLSRAIISALAHDLGKIEKFKEVLSSISLELFKKAPHYVISKSIFLELYPDYEYKNEIVEAIENHHSSYKKSNNYFLKLLIQADKEARKKEIDEWLIENKKSIEDYIKDEEKQNQDDTNKSEENTKTNEPKEEKEVVDIESTSEKKDNDTDIDNIFEEANKSMQDVSLVEEINEDNEYDYENIFEKFKELIHLEGYCNIIIKPYGIDFKSFIVPFENDKIVMGNAFVVRKLMEITGLDDKEVKEDLYPKFITYLKKKGIVGLCNPEKGFYVTKFNVFVKSKERNINMFCNVFYADKLGFDKLDYCDKLEDIELSIPNFRFD